MKFFMKKITKLFLSIVVSTVLFFSGVLVLPVGVWALGSESIAISSSTTPLLPGCATSYGFSIFNGLPCSDGAFANPASTGISDGTQGRFLPAGCASNYGFSIFTGQPCTNKKPASSVAPGAGVYLGGWSGWVNPTTKVVASKGKTYFQRPLDIGSRGDDVRMLQSFLATDPDLYPEGYINGYFGINTARAVGRLQVRYGLVQGDSEPTYGFVGPRTRGLLNALQEEM